MGLLAQKLPNPSTVAGFFTPGARMNCCITCKHFRDAKYSKVYITPRCTVLGDDDAMHMRRKVCGIDGRLYEPKHVTIKPTVDISTP